jgi:hypothetical protein
MTIPELIEILKAAEAGKKIERSVFGEPGEWRTLPDIFDLQRLCEFVFRGHRLRVKPEPREWWVAFYDNGARELLDSKPTVNLNVTKEVVRVREAPDQ